MEMGSASTNSNTSPSPCEPESIVDGLKFGKKIYFEDVGSGGAPGKSGPGGSSTGAPRKVQGGQQQPPRCQVEGCKVDLSDAKAYYSRHKVCGMHSKSPKVVVNGLEQRFCQQCSRFHQLPEFDQGKRSCRRRLAGHNERRRKPPPGSGLSSRYGRLCSTMSDNGRGGFLMDFSAYPRNATRDRWPRSYSADQLSGNCTAGPARSTPNPYDSHNPPSILYLQGSSTGTGCPSSGIPPGECLTFPSSGIPLGECFTGVSVNDSSCALSLLSNQHWGSRNRASGLGMNDLVNAGGAPTGQSTAPHGVNPYPNSPWGIKSEAGGSSHEMIPDLGLGQISQPLNVQFSSELELSHPQNRQYMELEQPRGYDSSTTDINWSL